MTCLPPKNIINLVLKSTLDSFGARHSDIHICMYQDVGQGCYTNPLSIHHVLVSLSYAERLVYLCPQAYS